MEFLFLGFLLLIGFLLLCFWCEYSHDDDSDDESVETVETKLDLFFDDEDYGKKVLRFMKRGDTIDDTMGDFEEKVQLVTHPEGNGR